MIKNEEDLQGENKKIGTTSLPSKPYYNRCCVVPGCQDRGSQRFSIPTYNSIIADVWKSRIANKLLFNTATKDPRLKAVICANHFDNMCFRVNHINKKALLRFSLPTINLPGFNGPSTRETCFYFSNLNTEESAPKMPAIVQKALERLPSQQSLMLDEYPEWKIDKRSVKKVYGKPRSPSPEPEEPINSDMMDDLSLPFDNVEEVTEDRSSPIKSVNPPPEPQLAGKCCVPGCGIYFGYEFPFPKDPAKREQWANAIQSPRLKNLTNDQLSTEYVCELHFLPKFLPSKPDGDLSEEAVPTLFFHRPCKGRSEQLGADSSNQSVSVENDVIPEKTCAQNEVISVKMCAQNELCSNVKEIVWNVYSNLLQHNCLNPVKITSDLTGISYRQMHGIIYEFYRKDNS